MNWTREFQGPSLYVVLLTIVFAAGWLLPNHYPPWNTFHANAWIASVLLGVGFWRLLADPLPVRISPAIGFLAGVAAIPWIQHWIGLLPVAGDALMGSLWQVGFAAAFALGEHWGRLRRGQPAVLVLSAACLAAIASVGLQIYQWLGFASNLRLEEIWVFPSPGQRPYANLGQPNQLASLLLWGLIGCAWAAHKGWLGRWGATIVAAVILFGVALTESRTALLTLTLAFAVLSVWRPRFLGSRALRTAQLLYLWYLACLFSLEPLGTLLGREAPLTVFERSAGELRFELWSMALEAARERPWLGFGWNHMNEGYLLVFPNHPRFVNWYAEQSHNLVLDLVLWVGWPLALGLLACIALWLRRLMRSLTSTEQLLTAAALAVMLVHAMLELPLHHGYFLWPFALLAGSANAGMNPAPLFAVPRRAAIAMLVALSCVVGIAVRDYFHVEAAFAELRFQLQHIGRDHDKRPPETVLLTGWRDFVVMSREEPHAGMPDAQIRQWRNLMLYNSSPLAFKKLVGALVLNGRLEEAQFWADRSCAVLAASLCKGMMSEWQTAVPKDAASAVATPS